MPAEKRMAALAIGVGDAKPLPYLSGALNGARAFHTWAAALGYEATLLVDDEKPVTLGRLREELEALLAPPKGAIHRLLIYFAGHGLIREAEEGLWLLSDWNRELRAVAVEVLRRRLYLYGIGQIAIFADACRSLPADIQAADLTADGVLGRGPVRQIVAPAIDKFIAAQDGTRTFAIPGPTPDEDRCVFSGVLLQGLWGTKPDAYSKVLKDKVTSRSLGAFLQTEGPQVAARYGCTLDPTVVPTFPEGDDVYFGDGKTPTPPFFPEWPPKEVLVGPGVAHVERGEQAKSGERPRGIGPTPRPSVPPIGPNPSQVFARRLSSQGRPLALETQSGFAVDGERVVAIWTQDTAFAERHGQDNWWQVGERQGYVLRDPVPVLIQFANGLFAATTALPKFIGSVLTEQRGVSALLYREIHASPRAAEVAEQAIAKMEHGGLRVEAKMDMAVELRKRKHADPVLGVISAYLYDSIGDVDSIRRMAFYYVEHNQPIPYDIAFLGQLQGERRDVLHVRVPPVARRRPRTPGEERFEWTYCETPPAEGTVGGFWPWLRQGWTFLIDDGSTLVLPGLLELVQHLSPSRFTTLDGQGAQQLALLFGLKPRP